MTNSSSERLGEFELIAKLFAPLATSAGAFGLTDDIALLTPRAGHDIVLKADAIVEGVHFRSSDPADRVAKKALRVNLSDLAAKGAEPIGYLLTLNLPNSTGMTWLEDFARGLGEDQKAYVISLFGGDTTSTPGPLTIAIGAIGAIPSGTMIRRSGAKPGDLVFVSGTIGDAAGGLAVLKGNHGGLPLREKEALVRRYQLPEPRLALGQALRGIASASLDVSDGLVADLGHIADVSHVRVAIEALRIPRSDALKALGDSPKDIVSAATAGDDYEIAFTAPAAKRDRVLEAAARTSTPVTEIGRVTAGTGITLLGPAGEEIPVARAGYQHF